jgi:hypothetical protein
MYASSIAEDVGEACYIAGWELEQGLNRVGVR